MTIALNITYDKKNDHIIVIALTPDRFTHYGFGTFLENIIPEEIEITPEAKEVLLGLPERGGLQGMEFWPDNRLAWASPSPEFMIPAENINVPDGAKKWISLL